MQVLKLSRHITDHIQINAVLASQKENLWFRLNKPCVISGVHKGLQGIVEQQK